jgi:replicative DNA helicase
VAVVPAGRTEGRVPPHDLEAEASVLGALLLDPAAITRVLDILRAEDFYRENNGQIYRAAINLFREGEPIDNVTLAAELEKMGVLERTGGRAHLGMLQEQTPTAANVEHYARIVKDRAYKRQLITAGTQVTGLGYDDALDAEEAVNQAQSTVYAISDDKVGSGMERLYDLLKPAMDRIDAQMAAGGAVLGVASGFHELDRMTNGFKASDMVVIAGRPSMGKALALDTPIPTPGGWKTMGDLRVGDQVFDERGRPCTVTFATPVMHGRPCYEVELSDGEVLVADGDHLWATSDCAARERGGRSLTVRKTRDLLHSLRTPDGRANHAIPACAALTYPERHLPIDPHALGVSLGRRGAAVALSTGPHAVAVRVPRAYLESSAAQRTALLRGLLGHPECRAFGTDDPFLAEDVTELVRSLGMVATRTEESGPLYRVTFGADRARHIEDIRPVASVPVRCIQVDSPSHLYVAGRSCAPTHNTSFVLNVALHAAVEQRQPVAIFSLEMSKEQLVERMLCEQARIDAQRLHRGLLSEAEHERLVYALGPLGDAPIYIDDSPMLDDLTLRLKARQSRAREGIEMLVIDYLQLMHGRQRSDEGNRVQEVSAISRSLKAIARELRIPVIAISQLSRAPEARPDKRPILSDLRESGCLTDDTRLLRADTGTQVTIRELLDHGCEGVLVWSLDENRRLTPAPLITVFPSGVKQVFRLRLASGRKVTASANHRFLMHEGWQRLDGLRPGDRIATPRRVPAPVGCAACGSPPIPTLALAGVGTATGALITSARTLSGPPGLPADDVSWDRVVEIEELGSQPVYDGTVAGTHNFVANGIIAHNSIEQDADLVMFLYRDEYYHREKSEKPGIAEVIVAKHRNGPTGSIELLFRKELTRFENIERRRPDDDGMPDD